MARLSPQDAAILFAIERNEIIRSSIVAAHSQERTAQSLAKRGLARRQADGSYVITDEGRRALRKWGA